ncbi:Hypothetical predicted protein, partial [Pelobates cultripes]
SHGCYTSPQQQRERSTPCQPSLPAPKACKLKCRDSPGSQNTWRLIPRHGPQPRVPTTQRRHHQHAAGSRYSVQIAGAKWTSEAKVQDCDRDWAWWGCFEETQFLTKPLDRLRRP